ncbi:hypothetical protein C7123_11225 [Tannerella serpentiformis]|uniref:hypothetical protein n=1 Tax=Tannerella serpentiformis TaxID=712710 RepID=UPI000840B96F|nr:hypothetical protein [Tannerella serpentiformis]AOH40310.1 hypothetical protein BCB71_03725 [Tannerella serpentiformis]AVV54215.1 hypothetical protein C7123_11225 [Tannerella serpentiformis]
MDRTRTFIFMLSGLLVVAGSALYITHWIYAPWLFAVGAAGVTVGYMTDTRRGDLDFRRRRLTRWNVFAGLAMVVASVFMFRGRMEWVAFLLIAALIQLYTSFVPTDKGKK